MNKSVVELIGNTPLLQLDHGEAEAADVFLKIESKNPSGSIKDRAAKYMIEAMIEAGQIEKGRGRIVEATSGNMGIALAMIGAAYGLTVTIVMPETMSVERRRLMGAYGADIVLTPGADGMQGAVDRAQEIADETGAVVVSQFTHPANVRAHAETTGPEILKALPSPDAFIAGVGTGGTITGVGQALKAHDASIQIVAVEPESSPVLSKGSAGSHGIQGIGANFVPEIYDGEVTDEVRTVRDEDAFEMTRTLARDYGILAGLSSGANAYKALELARELGPGHQVVSVLPDTGERYLSGGVFDV